MAPSEVGEESLSYFADTPGSSWIMETDAYTWSATSDEPPWCRTRHRIQDAPSRGSANENTLALEAVGTLEELPAYIVPPALPGMPPAP